MAGMLTCAIRIPSSVLPPSRRWKRLLARKPVLVREGGSIPIIEEMKRVLGADALMLGMCLPDARIHSPNENFPVDLFSKGIDMSQILLRRLGQIKH